MGYTTDFEGRFTLDRPLSPEHRVYLVAFSETRRMKRDPEKAALLPDPIRDAVGLPVGDEGAYFVGGGQWEDASVTDVNRAPGEISVYDHPPAEWNRLMAESKERVANGTAQPGVHCDWCPTEDGTAIEWNGSEKFYEYTAWLRYLIRHFLAPWGYTLNGDVSWRGEDHSDIGVLHVVDNVVTAKPRRRRATR